MFIGASYRLDRMIPNMKKVKKIKKVKKKLDKLKGFRGTKREFLKKLRGGQIKSKPLNF